MRRNRSVASYVMWVPNTSFTRTRCLYADRVRSRGACHRHARAYTSIYMDRPSATRRGDAACTSACARRNGAQRRRRSSTPRVGMLCLVVAAASVFLPASSAAGAGLGSAATVKSKKRATGAAVDKGISSIRGGARQSRDEHDHDPRARGSTASRRPRYARRPGGEESGGHAGGDSAGPRSRRISSSYSKDERSTSSSSNVVDNEEDEEGSWSGDDGIGSTGDGSDDSSQGDGVDGSSSSHENYDTEEGLCEEGSTEDEQEGGLVGATPGSDGDSSEGDQLSDSGEKDIDNHVSGHQGEGEDELRPPRRQGQQQRRQQQNPQRDQAGHQGGGGDDDDNSVEVCVVTWNLAEESPPARDVEFLRHASRESDLVAVGVQEIENLKPRRNEGGRTREWRRLLIRTLGRDFVRVGHHAMGAVQLTIFARRELLDRVKVIKLSEVVCGVGNVLQNKGGIGAYLRVDRTTFLFVAAHLAAHQGKLEERNAGYWRIATALNQEIPPAWVTHAARKRAKRAKAARREESSAQGKQPPLSPLVPWLPAVGRPLPPRGPFGDRVDRVFFFGDLNYRVDLSREDLELGVSVCRREQAPEEGDGAGQGKERERARRRGERRSRPGVTYPGAEALDALLDFDQLILARSRGAAFGGFSEARVTFEPTYKYDKGSERFDTSRKMRPPAWTDRVLYSPSGPHAVSPLKYTSVPDSCHSDHRPVYAKFRVQLAD